MNSRSGLATASIENDLAQTALDFCRECLGWEDAQHSPTGAECVFSARAHVSKRLMYTDLNAVMKAVRGWCDANEAAVEIGYYGYIPGEWEVQVATPASAEPVQSEDLCHAVLAACVEASRKLKATP